MKISMRFPHVVAAVYLAVLWLALPTAAALPPEAKVRGVVLVDLRTEGTHNPLGIDAVKPRLSWRIESPTRGTMQSAYRVRVALSPGQFDAGKDLLWDSGRVASDRSTQAPYAGPPPQSRQRYYWQVRVWNERGAASPWSAPAWWEMGLLSKTDWTAQWIAPPIDLDPTKSTPAPLLRSNFEVHGGIARARAYVTSLGLYELYLNGQRVGDSIFTPGWTSFDKRLQYQVYDVTALLREGANAVGAVLGDGWYRREPFNGWYQRGQEENWKKHHNNGKPLALLMQIEVTYEDGRTQRITSDSEWKTATGPILRSEIYNGEIYDARLERNGWTTATYDDHGWRRVNPAVSPAAALVATVGPPVKRIEEIKPVRIFRTAGGTLVADMGQNLAGWVRLRVRGSAGTSVTLRHAEVLDRNGEIYTENLRTAEQTVRYILKGGGVEVFEPHFTYQGFRYVAVEGYPGELRSDSLTGIVIHSDLERTGSLETSSPSINQLHHNIVWTQKANAIDVHTDNPQRDERLGYGASIAFFSPTAMLNLNVAGFFTKWLADLAADQAPDGALPTESPRALTMKFRLQEVSENAGRKVSTDRLYENLGFPIYGDASTIIPWNLYRAYGDTHILDVQYESMRRWVEFIQTQADKNHLWIPTSALGDWLDFSTTMKPTWYGSTASDLITTAFYAHSVDLLRRTARVLEKSEEADRYAQRFSSIRQAFQNRYVSHDGRVGAGTQTAYVLALALDLLPEALRTVAARHLVEDVRSRGHLTTGILGTPFLLDVLSQFGYDEEAYMLINRRKMPSWLYPITEGATTIWERWDGIRTDGSFQDPKMNSFNQCELGAIGPWMYGVIGGIALDQAAPGYKHILIYPRPGGGITYARASHVAPYGEVATSWRIDRGGFNLSVTIPANTTATVTLPGARLSDVLEGGDRVSRSNGIYSMRQVGSNAVVEIGSGRYEFHYPQKKVLENRSSMSSQR